MVGGAPANMVLILGNIGQLQEVAEGADHGLRRVARQWVEQGGEFGTRGLARFGVAIAGKAYCRLAHTLDNVKNRIPLLLAYRIAEDAAEEADVVAERFVLVGVERCQMHC